MDYILTQNEKGKQVPQKIGMGIVQRDGMEYEFDVIAEMTVDHYLTITKTRCFSLDGFEAEKPDGLLGRQIKEWLTEGEEAPAWPDGGYPSKGQFFQRALDVFGWSPADTAAELRLADFINGYEPRQAADMWRALERATSKAADPSTDFYDLARKEEISPSATDAYLHQADGDFDAALKLMKEAQND